MDIHEDLGMYAENTWCPGCGNFGILKSVQKAVKLLEDRGHNRENIAISAGIGCHGKIFDYLRLHGLYSLHGRAMATIQGMKIANPELKVISFHGDGDAMGEGISHSIFAAKRNADITMVIHDNARYALTTGQFTPTTKKGVKTPTSLEGNPEEPLDILPLILSAKATFVAQVYPGKMNHLAEVLADAVEHEGFSFVRVLQPCVTYNDTWKFYGKNTEVIENNKDDYEKAMELATQTDPFPLGILYQNEEVPPFHEVLSGDLNPVNDSNDRGSRLKAIENLFKKE